MNLRRLMPIAVKVVPLVMLAGAAGWAAAVFTGPHMKEQPSIRSFQSTMPAVPAGVVPLVDPIPAVPTTEQAAAMKNPLADPNAGASRDANAMANALGRGRVNYLYYCAFCHGDGGGGNGPVGESYVPAPTDLRRPATQNLPDGELLRRMLAGAGHEPNLNRVVPASERWYLVLHVRQFKK